MVVPVERDENADPLSLLVRRESKRLGVYGGKCRLRERNSGSTESLLEKY